ncbi:serine hydrolase domain-containing protein [Streptomyces sp. AcE210]|uniref:serine hydrolase domain-containing protein n=1 Tax=Streptomyces sp. AcE210 TaxID=2292703 RepID=UPI000E30597F|nr:serine hydrolase domain-containing protein [Streptomyces sp. AcE210]RFC77026.1 class A beta-lactamase-related serine hydrolase [Streptomyces sp. AcE210]
MTSLQDIFAPHVRDGSLPGAVALVARGDRVEVETAGSTALGGGSPMARDSIFRIASITKPITAAAVMMLVDDGRIALDDPVDRWLPEIAKPVVVRTPDAPVDDVVPAARPITVADLLTFRAGWGFPSDFSLPAVQALFGLQKNGLSPQLVAPPDEWMAHLARVPLLNQPGEAWLYNTCSDIQGVLISRVSGSALPDFLAERVFEPLGMTDTGFEVPAGKLDRFTTSYRPRTEGGLEQADPPDGQWGSLPEFPSGAGGLVSTADDWYAFARMLLGEGVAGGRRLLSSDAVHQMTTDHLTAAQREASGLFTEGQGWGFGGSVDVAPVEPWNVMGRYGWVGGTGTAAHLVPSTGAVGILLTQVEMTGPTPPALMRDFWRYVAAETA